MGADCSQTGTCSPGGRQARGHWAPAVPASTTGSEGWSQILAATSWQQRSPTGSSKYCHIVGTRPTLRARARTELSKVVLVALDGRPPSIRERSKEKRGDRDEPRLASSPDMCSSRRPPAASRMPTATPLTRIERRRKRLPLLCGPSHRDGRIRTGDPLNPIQVRYRTAPRPGRNQANGRVSSSQLSADAAKPSQPALHAGEPGGAGDRLLSPRRGSSRARHRSAPSQTGRGPTPAPDTEGGAFGPDPGGRPRGGARGTPRPRR